MKLSHSIQNSLETTGSFSGEVTQVEKHLEEVEESLNARMQNLEKILQQADPVLQQTVPLENVGGINTSGLRNFFANGEQPRVKSLFRLPSMMELVHSRDSRYSSRRLFDGTNGILMMRWMR